MSDDTARPGSAFAKATADKLNPAALRPEDAAKALGISEDMLRADLAADASTNPDGTVNLVHYAAWLNREMSRNDAP